MSIDKKIKSNRFLLFLCGGVLLIAGITLVLICWKDVVAFFRGVSGIVLAIGGLVLLYMMKE